MKFPVKDIYQRWFKVIERSPSAAWVLSILWLLLISWLAFVWNLGNTGLVDETEPLFAEAARQITVTGDWITPYFNGMTRFDKPILIYWLMAIAYKTIGVNEWAARLPSALSAIALTFLGFYTLRFFGFPSPAATAEQNNSRNHRQLWLSALLGASMIVLNPETIAWARTGVSDMLLTGCMDSALLAFFLGYAQPSQPKIQMRWYIAFYVLCALAVLTKGPVGIVLPGFIITAFLIYLGKFWQVLREMRPLLGCMIMGAIALPWYILVTLANGEAFISSFFGYHNVERFTGVVNHHSAPWYFYFLVVLIGFLPWSIYLPSAIARLRFWQRDRWQSSLRSSQLGLFALFWFAGIFVFFTIAVTKLPSYMLPIMPAAAILVALLWSDKLLPQYENTLLEANEQSLNYPASINTKNLKSNGFFWSIIVNLLFLLIVAGACLYMPNIVGYDPAVPNLRELIQEWGLPIRGGLSWGIAAILGAILLIKRQWKWIWTVNLIGFLAFIIFFVTPAYFMIDQTRQLPLRQLAAIASQQRQPNEELVMIGFKKPSLVFYAQVPVSFFDKSSRAMNYIRTKLLESSFHSATTESKSTSILLLTAPKELNNIGLQPNQYQTLGHTGAYELIRITQQ